MTVTTTTKIKTAAEFYALVQASAHLRTADHGRIWTRGTLNMLGVNLSKSAKKALSNALPDDLKKFLGGVFWLAFFRDTNITALEFQNRVARRSGNTDAHFAKIPVTAVFGAIKQTVSPQVAKEVADSLSPELRGLWDKA
ncbi:MAG: DUF2267 domain-containing protein [Chloroflexi bacterium]|nr:DUF2267 domain-containing protein [Chloroflexota bacterium]